MKNDHADTTLKLVVKALADARKAQGLSHETVAQKAGITRPAVSHIEGGKRKPSLLVCLRIAKALDLQLWQLLKKFEK
jgi:transcriptional regulator with XRE-family HTH domain